MKIKGRFSESFPMYMAFLAAGLVAAIIGFFIIYNSLSGEKPDAPVSDDTPASSVEAPAPSTPTSSYTPTDEETEEMKDAAIKLISNNYEVLKLYYTKGMNHEDEPYGNIPEDGYYTVNNQKYDSIDQLNELVKSTYIESAAETVINNSLGDGPVYAVRPSGDLGIKCDFAPIEYNISWDNPNFKLYPESSTECALTVTVRDKETSNDVVLDGVMKKTDDGWRLGSVIY